MNRVFKGPGVALIAFVLVLTTLANAQAEGLPEGASNKPNVLFIAVDDLRCEMGCYGVSEIKTPNFDRLASSGVTFTRAYCQQAVCNPSRASVMTGLRPDSTQVWDLVTDFRTTIPDVVTLPQHFRRHGYGALGFGKIFHNTFPDHVSWDEPHRWPEESKLWSDQAKERLAEFRRKMTADGKPQAKVNRMRAVATESVELADSEHVDGAIAEQALSAMRRLAEANQPFFLAAGFVRPHLPFVVPRKYWDLYGREQIPLATNGFLPRGAPAVAFGDRSRGGFYELCDYMGYAMRTDRYRYVEWQDRNTRQVLATELYDHARDSFENNNVAGDKQNGPQVAELSRQLWAALPRPQPDRSRGKR